MARAALKALSRQSRKLTDVLHYESSDRAVAIIEATNLDNQLMAAILLRLVPLTIDEEGKLFAGDAPLASFSARIRMAYALGIISRETRTDLDAIRDIRNAFAHAMAHITFETDAVKSACLSLKARKSRIRKLAGLSEAPATPRECFESACHEIFMRIWESRFTQERPEVPPSSDAAV